MSFEVPGFKNGVLVAAADLSTHQFKLVKMTPAGVNICTAAADIAIGVLQNAPKAGETAEIMATGISKLVAGGVVAIGDTVSADATGRGVTVAVATTGRAIALEVAAAAGVVIAAQLCLKT